MIRGLRAAGRLAALALVPWLGGCAADLGGVDRVVLVTLDTTRADRLGCYGYEKAQTPRLDALAREAVLFEHAVSPVPVTLASHATMFTGLDPMDHGVRYNLTFRLGPSADTLAERLRGAGFATAAIPASYILHERFGLDQGFDLYVTPPKRRDEDEDSYVHPTAVSRPAEEGVDLALDWLRSHGGKSFLWLHFYDPHWPYEPPFPYSSRFRGRSYDGEIAYVDTQLGRLLDWLRGQPDWNRTLVIVAGDHGEGLYDHDERWHSTLVYESTQHVPLIIRAPGGPASRVKEPVGLIDLMPTVLDLAGVAAPQSLRGVSLRQALRGGRPPKRPIYFETLAGHLNYGWAELKGLRVGRWKLIDSKDPELYDLHSDPGELNNLASFQPTELEDLRAVLGERSASLSSDRAEEATQIGLDPETEELLSSLGYVAGGIAGATSDGAHPRDRIHLEPELLQAQTAVANRMWDRLEDTCRYVLEQDEDNAWALNNLVIALLNSGRAAEALDHAFRLVELSPRQAHSFSRVASIYKALGKPEEAYVWIQRGLAISPESEQLVYLGLAAAFDLGRKTVCEKDVPEARASHPKSGRILVMEARCRAREGDLAGALAALEDAVENGFRALSLVGQAPDFVAVAETAEFKALEQRSQTREKRADR